MIRKNGSQMIERASQVVPAVKNLTAGDMRCEFNPWVGKIPWRWAWKPTPVFLSGESHGQRSLVDYSPQCQKEPHMTEATARTQMFGSKITLELESKAKAERISVG